MHTAHLGAACLHLPPTCRSAAFARSYVLNHTTVCYRRLLSGSARKGVDNERLRGKKEGTGSRPSKPFSRHSYKFLLAFLGVALAHQTIRWLPSEKKVFDAPRFTAFTMVSRQEASPTSVMLTLRPDVPNLKTNPYSKLWEKGTWSVEAKQPLLQIARSYTPLPPDENTALGDLRFLIRKEHKGEMSGYLYALQPGAKIELRGPHPEFDLPEMVTDVVFLAGGTGIAPALQVVYTLLEFRREEDRPRIRIAWANRRREDCVGGTGSAIEPHQSPQKEVGIVVKEIQRLQQKYPEHLQVEYLVDEEGIFLDQNQLSQLTKSGSEVKFGPVTTRIDSRLFFVSGPEGFVNYFAGPKEWQDGKQVQGGLGGILGRMRLRDWKVCKL